MNWVRIPARHNEKRWRLDGGDTWELCEIDKMFIVIENPDRIGQWGRNVRWIERSKDKVEESLMRHLQLVRERVNLDASSQGVET